MKNIVTVTFIFVVTFVYAFVRYNIMGDVPFSDIPTFIINKVFSFSLIILLLIISIKKVRSANSDIHIFAQAFKLFLVCHILLSLGLLSQEYFPKLFSEGKLSLLGNLAILAGVVGAGSVFIVEKEIKNIVISVLATLHLIFIGAKGWLSVEKWYGYMPPITLLSFLISITCISFCLKKAAMKTFVRKIDH